MADPRRIRVAMFSEQFYPMIGGRELQIKLVSAALVAQGVAVTVITHQRCNDWPRREVLPDGVTVWRIPDVDLNVRFPRIRRLGFGVTTLLLRIARTALTVRAIAKDVDVLHAHNVASPVPAMALHVSRRCGVRSVATPVSAAEWFDLRLLAKYPSFGRRCARWVREDVDRWVAISAAVEDELERAGIRKDRIARIPNGVDVTETATPVSPVASRFLHLGRLATTAPRDVEGLIEAFEVVAQAHPAPELALVGPGDRLDAVRARVSASAARARIHVPGAGDGASWRRWADCLVQPSFLEGMSNSLLQGMAAGRACVAYDVPSNREVLDHGRAGILVPVGDRAALARELLRLAMQEGAALEWGRRARARAEGVYDVRKVALRTRDLYESLMG